MISPITRLQNKTASHDPDDDEDASEGDPTNAARRDVPKCKPILASGLGLLDRRVCRFAHVLNAVCDSAHALPDSVGALCRVGYRFRDLLGVHF